MKQNEHDLLHRYLDGAITPEELESLEALLRGSAEARATLRSLATIDAKWQQISADEVVPMRTLAARDPSMVDFRSAKERAFAKRNPTNLPLWMALTAIATTLVVAAFGWLRSPGDTPTVTERSIAKVIRIEGECKTDLGRVIVDGGDLLPGEELTMTHGLIEFAFRDTGVHVLTTAPLKAKLESTERLFLHEGEMKLVVPPQGVGFVVDTAERKFIDLGTSFVVTASRKGSEVLVLDGQISVGQHAGESEDLMYEGEFAKFDRNGKLKKRSNVALSRALPELSVSATVPRAGSLRGMILTFDHPTILPKDPNDDVIGRELMPLIHSGFQNRACLEVLKQGDPIAFRGIAGAFREFPDRTGLTPYSRDYGWMSWYHGEVIPPRSGRYRFWGYADNHLLVAINGKPVFDGSRYDSPFKELGIPRSDNPSLPCLIAKAGFACSDWIELSGDAIELDIMFGEVGGNLTSGLLLVEREGDTYEETLWGQPKWPLFLTEVPEENEIAEFERLVSHLEEKTMGSFSIAEEMVWKVVE